MSLPLPSQVLLWRKGRASPPAPRILRFHALQMTYSAGACLGDYMLVHTISACEKAIMFTLKQMHERNRMNFASGEVALGSKTGFFFESG